MKDLHSSVSVAVMIAAAVLDADPTPLELDLQGFEAAEIVLSVGAGGITFDATNKIEFVLEHSDDALTWTNVATADVLGVSSVTDGIIKSLVAAHASAAAYRFGYIGGKRYVRLTPDFSGTHVAGTPIAATLIKGHPNLQPQAAQA